MTQKRMLAHKQKLWLILGLLLVFHVGLFFLISTSAFTAVVEVEILLAVAGEWITSHEALTLMRKKKRQRRKMDVEKFMTKLSKKLSHR